MNQLKAGAALNYVIIGLNTLTGLLYTPFMLRCLGQDEYGLYSLVASVITYLTLLDFGFGSAIVRYTARIRATGTQREEWSLYGMFLSAYAVLGLLVTIGGVVLYFNVDRMFDRTMTPDELSQARVMMGLMVFNLAVTFPFSIFGSIISAYERFVFQRTVSIVRILLSTAVLIGVLMLGYKAVAMVIVQTVFSIATLIANVLYCRLKLRIRIRFDNLNIPLLKEIAIFSFWNFLGAIVDRIYWATGQFVLGVYSGAVAVAIFSLSITLMNLYISMSTSLSTVLLPRLTVLSTRQDSKREIDRLFIKTGRLQFCVLCLILCGFTVFGRLFIVLWAGESYILSFTVTLILFYTLLCPLIQNIGITILLARGQQMFRSCTYLFIALVSLLGQLYFVPKYDVIGCVWVIAVAHFLGQWLIMNVYYWLRQGINISGFWKEIFKMSIAPVILTVIAYYLVGTMHICSWWTLIIAVASFTAMYVPVFYKFSMNEYEKNVVMGVIYKLKNKSIKLC